MLTLIKPAGIEVVSLEEVKAQLRLDHVYEDEYLLSLIQASTNLVEDYLGRSLISQTWQLIHHQLIEDGQKELTEIYLPRPSLIEVLSVCSVRPNNIKHPIKRYMIETAHSLPKLVCQRSLGVVEVIYRAGYGDYPKHIPSSIRQAILLSVADFYENRANSSIQNQTVFQALLAPHRIIRMG
ncbi:MAG: head-tail connector protein [Alphaproteobacteria bacterium]|nr:head-tail connector protein [Alphaproteobacteria bacterium]